MFKFCRLGSVDLFFLLIMCTFAVCLKRWDLRNALFLLALYCKYLNNKSLQDNNEKKIIDSRSRDDGLLQYVARTGLHGEGYGHL